MADDIMISTATHQSSSRVLVGGGSSSSARFTTHDDHTSGGFAVATTESDDQQPNEVLLSVVLSSGRQHDIRVSRDITVRKLKQLCIPKHIQDKRLSGFEEATGGVPGAVASPAGVSDEDDESRFKLVHANSGRCLADAQSLSDQSIVHSDSLLLLPRKTKPPQVTSTKTADAAGRPASVTVDQLTSSLDGKNFTRNTRKDSNFNNYLTEMRKIILSLIYVSHRLLCHNKEAIDMFREAIVLLKAARASDEKQSQLTQGSRKISAYSLTSSSSAGRNSDVNIRTSASSSAISSSNSQPSSSGGGSSEHSQVHVDSDLVKQLTDMGFKPHLSKLALVLNGMSVSMATEWLLAHGDDEEVQDEDTTAAILLSQQAPSPTPPNPPTQGNLLEQQSMANSRSDASGEQPMEVDGASAVASESDEGGNNGEEVLQCSDGLKVLQEFHQLSFQPEPKALKSLLDMGFPEQESCDALRVNGNHEHMACEWLLTWPRRPSVEEWEEGIDASSPMYKAIVSNPLVQLLLNNPKTLLALEDILGHPNSMSHYLNDPDAGPLLVQISSIFSTERNATSSSSTSSGSESTSSTTTTAIETASTEQAVASVSGNESVQRREQSGSDSSHNNTNDESMITQMEDDDDDSLSTLI